MIARLLEENKNLTGTIAHADQEMERLKLYILRLEDETSREKTQLLEESRSRSRLSSGTYPRESFDEEFLPKITFKKASASFKESDSPEIRQIK